MCLYILSGRAYIVLSHYMNYAYVKIKVFIHDKCYALSDILKTLLSKVYSTNKAWFSD